MLTKEMTTIKQVHEAPSIEEEARATIYAVKRRACTHCRTYQVAAIYHVLGTHSHYCYRNEEVVHVVWPGER